MAKTKIDVGPLVRVGPNKQGTNKRGDPLSGMQRSVLGDVHASGDVPGGKKAAGRNTGAPSLPGTHVKVAPGRHKNVKHPL